jgi:hypothetical protein
MNRTQRILALLLVVQAALLGILALRSGGRDGAEPRPLLPGLGELVPARIRIDGADDKFVSLTRGAEGWTLEQPAGYPAEPSAVTELLDKLGGLHIRRPVVSSDRYHATLRVAEDEYERRLRVWSDGASDPEIDLILGSSPNFDISHVRLAGDDPVYEVRGLGTFDLRAEPSAWVVRNLIDVSAEDVVGLKLRNAHGEIELSREDGVWVLITPALPGASELDQAEADSLVQALCSVRLDEPAAAVAGGGMGLDAPVAELELRYRLGRPGDDGIPLASEQGLVEPPDALFPPHPGRDGKARRDAGGEEASVSFETLRVLVGSEPAGIDAEGQRFAAAAGSGFAVVLGRFDAEKFTSKRAADLLSTAE